MRWVRQLGKARQLGEASCLASADRVTRVGETTFLHVNGLACPPETRQQARAKPVYFCSAENYHKNNGGLLQGEVVVD